MHRLLRAFPLLTGLGLLLVLAAASCGKMPLLAPTGTVINLTITSETAALNSSVDIIAVLIENGQQSGGTGTGTAATGTSVSGAGTPVQDGTVVSFTTSIGTIEPAEAKTVNGRVTVKLKTTGESGKATITAYSGGAKSTATISIGAANAKSVSVTASPQNLPATGGTSTISAQVQDASGNGIAGIPVTFSTTKGTLSATSVNSNSTGIATTTLTTTAAADVTATAGSVAGVKVSIGVATRSTVSIALAGSATPAVSTAAQFTVTPGSGAAFSSVTVNYGDGGTKALGSLTSATTVTHYYSSSGIFDVTVSGTDADGVVSTAVTQVAVGSLTATLTAGATSVARGTAIAFTATVTPTGAAIDRYEWDFPSSTGTGTVTYTSTANSQNYVFPGSLPASTYQVTVRVYPVYGSAFSVHLFIPVT